ncbi:NAD-dependent epimerase/dehydratase family protein [Aquirufa lenticrescens]
MKVLVTGCAGFIGFHLSKKLLSEGHDVVGIDNLNDYYDVNLKLGRLMELGVYLVPEADCNQSELYKNFTFIRGDIRNKDSLNNIFITESIEYVFHLAAQAGVRYSIINPDTYIENNISGFLNVLECSRMNKCKHLFYASSSSVYGNLNINEPLNEDLVCNKPVSIYAASKISNEIMAHTYYNMYNLCSTGFRFFTVYGPWGRPDMAPHLFADNIINDKPIKVFNRGELYRDFTFIDDIIAGIFKVFNYYSANNKQDSCNIFNIGCNEPVNLLHFIKLFEFFIGKNAVKEFLPMQDGDVYKTYADISKIQEFVNYSPSVSIDEGVQLFINWYINYYKVENINN